MTITTFHELENLGREAIPLNDDEWGSERQVEAETRFFDAVFNVLDARSGGISLWNAIEDYCLKATTEEAVVFCLSCVRGEVSPETHPWTERYFMDEGAPTEVVS